MKKPKYIDKQFQAAMRDLGHLVEQTEQAIMRYRDRGDYKAVAELIFQQRHNLKVLFRNLEIAKRGDK